MALTHQPVTASGYLSSTTQVILGKGALGASSSGPGAHLHGVQLLPDGVNACSVVIYNSDAATAGQEVATLSIAASTTAPTFITFNNPIVCEKGIRAVLAGTGGKVIVSYTIG